MKYSSIKASIFGNAQKAEGLSIKKLRRAVVTRWLSHGEASNTVIERFHPLIDSLDEIINLTRDPTLTGLRTQLLNPDNVLFLLLLSDILTHVNRFSKFLQTRNLIYSNVNYKLEQLKSALLTIEEDDGPKFKNHATDFLNISISGLGLARRSRSSNFLADGNLDEAIADFKTRIKIPFMQDLINEIDNALKVNDNVFLSFDVFNVRNVNNLSNIERVDMLTKLIDFYGTRQISNFRNEEVVAEPLFKFKEPIEGATQFFFQDFTRALVSEEARSDEEVATLLANKKLNINDVDSYKDEHPIQADAIYRRMVGDREQYPEIMKLFKFSLLITPSTANVERGFSILNLVHTKQRNRLLVPSLDKLMRLVLVGPAKFTNNEYKLLLEKYNAMGNRRLEL
jgi:hypothetical protein